VAVAAGSWHAVALRADGRVVAWGNNQNGQTNVPASATNIVAIAASEQATYALQADGTVITWTISGNTLPFIGLNDAIDIFCHVRPNSLLALRRNGRLFRSGGFAPPSQATNIAAIAGSGESGIALRGTGSPVFPGLPVNRTVVSGSRAYFRALATGELPLSYQWQRDGTNILGATNVVLTITNAQPSHVGAYTLVASNAFGIATNGSMLLTVLPLEITQHPSNRVQYLGGNVSFSVVAEGQGPLYYQWLHNDEPLAAGTNATLTLTNLQPSDTGSYSVIVSNLHGFELSQPAQLELPAILVTSQPPNQTILINSNRTLAINVAGIAPFGFHWQLNGQALAIETNTVNLNPAALTDSGTYSVTISNSYGSTNITFDLTVVPSLIIGTPLNQSMYRGGTASFALNVQTLIPAYYQWMLDGAVLPEATNAVLNLTNVQSAHAGTYSIVLSNSFEMVTNSAWLAIVDVAAWGGANAQSTVPPNATNLIGLAVGWGHNLVLNQGGDIIGWGDNFAQQASHPVGLTNCIAIAAGNSFSVALQNNGESFAWGSSSLQRTNVPPDLTNTVAISSGHLHSLGLRSDGLVRAWGDNAYGQTNVPVGLSNVVMISAGQHHSLAVHANGTVTAWGRNDYGQASIPAVLSNVVQVAGGGDFSLALRSDGSLMGWGRNTQGQTVIPVSASNVVAIAAGFAHWLALRADGTIIAWGYNANGQTNVPSGLTNVVAIAANPNAHHSRALIGDGPPVQRAVLHGPSAADVSFAIQSHSGRVYRLEYTTTLNSPEWIPLPLVAGTGSDLILRDSNPDLNSQRYYRVLRW
jgi:alpha-tubulin suppressor-like RCC1 family protein